MGEVEFAYDDCAIMSSTASSANICIVCASISAREGSTKNNDGCKLDRNKYAYDRNRAMRSSPPHDIPDLVGVICGGG
jgi:hypothetical protein